MALSAFLQAVARLCDAPSLTFTDDAQSIFDNWLVHHERRLRSDHAKHEALVAHLSKYRYLLPSLALLYQIGSGDGEKVSHHAVQASVRWCNYLESHTRHVYSLGVDYDTAPLTARDVLRKRWG